MTLSNSSEGKVFEMTFSARNFIETICGFSSHFRDSLFCNTNNDGNIRFASLTHQGNGTGLENESLAIDAHERTL